MKRILVYSVLLVLFIFFNFEVFSRPGGGRSYRSSSSGSSSRSSSSYRSSGSSYKSSSGSSYRSNSSSSYKSSGSSYSSGGSYSSGSSAPQYNFVSLYDLTSYSLSMEILKDSSFKAEEKFSSSYIPTKTNTYFLYSILLPNASQNSGNTITIFNTGSGKTETAKEDSSLNKNYAVSTSIPVPMLKTPGTFSIIYANYDPLPEIPKASVFKVPVYSPSGYKTLLKETTFSIKFPENVNPEEIKVIPSGLDGKELKNKITYTISKGLITGKAIITDPKENAILSISFPENTFVPDSISLKEKGFDRFLEKKKIDLNILDGGFVDVEDESIYFLKSSGTVAESISRSIYRNYSKVRSIITGEIKTSVRPSSIFYHSYDVSLYWFTASGNPIKKMFTTHGYIKEEDSSPVLLWESPKQEYFPTEKMEVNIQLPGNVKASNIKIEGELHSKKPLRILKEGTVVRFLMRNLSKGDYLKVKLVLPEGAVGSGSFFKLVKLNLQDTRLTNPFLFYSPFILLLIGIPIAFLILKRKKNAAPDTSGLVQARASSVSFSSDPDFSLDDFYKKAEWTSNQLTSAWLKGDMSVVRSLVSSGVYNRFRVQLAIMDKEGMKNFMKDYRLLSLKVITSLDESPLQSIHVLLRAEARDINLPKDTPKKEIEKELNFCSVEPYEEVWSFVRSAGAKTVPGRDLFSNRCPSCGSPADKSAQSNRCENCGSVYNSGKYDWVLSEITQTVEWSESALSSSVSGLSELRKVNPGISPQVVEDRTSYLFWRWTESRLKGNPDPLRRDAVETYLSELPKSSVPFYDIAVGAVDTQSLKLDGNSAIAKVKVKWSAADTKGAEPYYRENTFTIILEEAKTELLGFAGHSCISCGSPLPESDSLSCEYCGAEVPGKVKDWLLKSVN
ncbi:MAG: TIM44-like domain-containing protein [Leptospiraceae bacterium]|nr:TIM44-like domain-containing protein [Leptospiraceae bacterium]MCP5498472.1 TIM44-like domain-containing protein [Leptospiraceae bacterium]